MQEGTGTGAPKSAHDALWDALSAIVEDAQAGALIGDHSDLYRNAVKALEQAARERAEYKRVTLDRQADQAARDIEEGIKLIRRAKHRLGYYPEPEADMDHPAADLARRVREAQTTLDLALEELGYEIAGDGYLAPEGEPRLVRLRYVVVDSEGDPLSSLYSTLDKAKAARKERPEWAGLSIAEAAFSADTDEPIQYTGVHY